MKLFVGKEARQFIVAGALLGVFIFATDPSAPAVYWATIAVGTVFCLYNDGRFDRILPWRRRR